MTAVVPHPARYEARRSPDGTTCVVFDTFQQKPVAFFVDGYRLTMSQAIGAAGRLNRAYAMACNTKEDAANG